MTDHQAIVRELTAKQWGRLLLRCGERGLPRLPDTLRAAGRSLLETCEGLLGTSDERGNGFVDEVEDIVGSMIETMAMTPDKAATEDAKLLITVGYFCQWAHARHRGLDEVSRQTKMGNQAWEFTEAVAVKYLSAAASRWGEQERLHQRSDRKSLDVPHDA